MTQGQWQPIETAPKDGTPILGFDGDDMTVVKYSAPSNPASKGYWTLLICGSYAEDGDWTPEFWQPLPAPPVNKKVVDV